MKKHIVFPFILCMCMFLTSCGVKMTGVKIQNVGELTTGDRQSLVLDYEFNHDGSDKEKEKVIDKTQLIFSSDNMSVANIVGDGKTILAGTGGTATITVRSLDGTIHDSINVTVLARPKEFSIPHELTLTLGSEEVSTITPTVQPEDFDYSGCEYSSSNEGVVTVDQDGNLTPVTAGTASVYAKLPKLNIERECKVTVIAPIEKITLSKSDASINVGEMVKLSCTTYPETPDTSILQWSTSDSSIATVDASGTVTGVGKGMAKAAGVNTEGYVPTASFITGQDATLVLEKSVPIPEDKKQDVMQCKEYTFMKASGSPEMKEAEKVTVSNGVGGVMRFDMQNGDTFEVFGINTETGTCSARKRSKDSDGFGETVALNLGKGKATEENILRSFMAAKAKTQESDIDTFFGKENFDNLPSKKRNAQKSKGKGRKKSDNK